MTILDKYVRGKEVNGKAVGDKEVLFRINMNYRRYIFTIPGAEIGILSFITHKMSKNDSFEQKS